VSAVDVAGRQLVLAPNKGVWTGTECHRSRDDPAGGPPSRSAPTGRRAATQWPRRPGGNGGWTRLLLAAITGRR